MDPVPSSAAAAIAPGDLRIVLVGTQHPGNIGSAARAMRTMGFDHLVLVAPERFPHNEADMMAAGAGDVLASARVCGTLVEAVADCRLVLGCTARSRRVALDELAPRDAAARMRVAAADAPVALVFGRERTGLDNDELQLCHAAVHIPSDPGYGSLNLAAAVQVLCYELRLAHLEAAGVAPVAAAAPQPRREGLASHAEIEGFFAQLAETLDAIDFHKGRAPDSAMRKLRRIFLRSDLDTRELRLLRGVLADAQRMARLAGERGAAGGGQVL